MRHKDIVIISTADWNSPIQTNKQYVSKELAKLGYRIIYVESLGMRSIKFRKSDIIRVFKRLIKAIIPYFEVEKNIYVVSPVIIPGAKDNKKIFINKILFNLKLNFSIFLLSFSKDLIWTYNPLSTLYLNLKSYKYSIYHAVDSIEHQPFMPYELIMKQEKILASNVNKIFVTSKNLLKKFSTYNNNISYYNNVCDFDHFAKARHIKKEKIPKDIFFIKKPIVGFIGSISEYKLDFNLIINTSKKLQDISFVFIGPTTDIQSESQLDNLLKQKNIYMIGYKKYEELPYYCAFFDIAWLPLNKNEYTKSMFPMKFFEYLAAGLPVISTSINSLEEYGNIALLSENNCENMIKNIKKALTNKGPKLEMRLKAAKENTYEKRTRSMLNEIEF